MKPTDIKQVKAKAITVIAGTSILLTTFSLSHEIINSNKKEPAKKVVSIKDPAINAIEKQILTPVRLQNRNTHVFSRARPSRSNIYQLVEVSSNEAEGARHFDILVTHINSRSSQTKHTNPLKVEPKTYLKLKYLTVSGKLLIQQNHEWVEKSEHKYLKLLPVPADKK